MVADVDRSARDDVDIDWGSFHVLHVGLVSQSLVRLKSSECCTACHESYSLVLTEGLVRPIARAKGMLAPQKLAARSAHRYIRTSKVSYSQTMPTRGIHEAIFNNAEGVAEGLLNIAECIRR